jgi:hypothetical protein
LWGGSGGRNVKGVGKQSADRMRQGGEKLSPRTLVGVDLGRVPRERVLWVRRLNRR